MPFRAVGNLPGMNANGQGRGKLTWQTPLARDLLMRYQGTTAPQTPEAVLDWLRRHLPDVQRQIEPPRLTIEQGPRRLTFRLHQQTGDSDSGGDWLIVMPEISDDAVLQALGLRFTLNAREAEVLYWMVKGKVNRDIGDILGSSPATVKKTPGTGECQAWPGNPHRCSRPGREPHPSVASAV